MKKIFGKHDLVKIVFGMILLTVILTWIIPQTSFNTGELVKGDITRVGMFDLGLYGLVGMSYFPHVVAFIFVLGVFYQFLSKLSAYQTITNSLASKVKGKEILFSLIVSFILAALASIINEYYVLIAFIPFIITICSKAGMDKISSFVTTFGAVLVGIFGSTISTKIVGMNVQYFNLKFTDYLLEKIIFFFVVFVVYSLFNVLYLRKHSNKSVTKETAKNETKKITVKSTKSTKTVSTKTVSKKSAKKATKASAAKATDVKVVKVDSEGISGNFDEKKQSIIPLIVVAILAIITILLAYIPWTSVFEVDWFTNAYNWVLNDVKFFDVPIFSYILGGVAEFGSWDLFGIQIVMLLAMFILQLCYRVSVDTVIDSICDGLKSVGKLVVILLMVYIVLELTVFYPVVPTIVSEILGSKFNVLTTTLSGIVTNLFTVEYQYTINMVYSNFAQLYANNLNVVSMILQLTYGFVSFFAPTSAVLLVGLSYLNISYKEWMKYIWKFLVVALALIIALAYIIA